MIIESVIIKLHLIFIAFPKTLYNPLLKNGTVFLSVLFFCFRSQGGRKCALLSMIRL